MESLLVQVHFPVGLVDLLGNIAVPVTPGNTAGDGDMLFLHGPERVTDTGMEVLPAGFAVDDDELVTACAVDLFAKGPEETVCCTANEGISGLMSLEVIDLLQAVQIEVGDAQAAAILPGQRLTDLVVPVSVIESGRKILPCCSVIFRFWSSICSWRYLRDSTAIFSGKPVSPASISL